MMKFFTLAFFISIVLTIADNSFSASKNDSLAYLNIRTRVLKGDSAYQIITTTDALFEAGLFLEAVEILQEHAPSASIDTFTAPAHIQSRHMHWRISSGVDYYRLNDLDTVAMTSEELRDHQRLTETPLSLWARARASIRPLTSFIEEINPETYISERKGRFETLIKFKLPEQSIRFESSVKGEKWFRSDASGETPFDPAKPQDSDMGGGHLRLTLNNQKNTDAILLFAIPASVDLEHYRHDRSGYESFIQYRLLPSIEIPYGTLPVNLRFSGQVEFEDYYRKESVELDVLRMSTIIEANRRSEKRTATVSITWMGDRYTNSSNLNAIDRFEGTFRGASPIAGPLGMRLLVHGIYESEKYGDENNNLTIYHKGKEFTTCPGIEFMLFKKRLRIGPDLLWERRTGATEIDNSIWEGRQAVEPGLQAVWSSGILDASIRASYRSESFDKEFKSPTVSDNRSFRGALEISVSPFTKLSIDLFTDYQYRVYESNGNRARTSENIAISVATTLQW